jgi:hemerythrin
MTPLDWDVTLETGDPVVDRQHRAICALFNELESAADNRDSIVRALDYLTEHVLIHFATEEELMKRVGYPAVRTEEHVAEHHKLTDAVREFVLQFHVGALEHTGPLVAFLRGWITEHVNGWDRELVVWARARNGFAVAQKDDATEGPRAS